MHGRCAHAACAAGGTGGARRIGTPRSADARGMGGASGIDDTRGGCPDECRGIERQGALRQALRGLPRRRTPRRHRSGPAAGQPQAAAPRRGGQGDRRRPPRHPDAGLLRRARTARRRGAGRLHPYAARSRTPLRHGGDRAQPRRASAAGHPGRPAGVRGRSPVPVHRRGARRPPRHRTRRRPLRAAAPLSHPLRAARRTQVLSGRALRLPRLARWMDHPVRPLQPHPGRRDPRRHQHPQPRGVLRRPVRDGRELPAAHPGAARRPGARAACGDPGRERSRGDLAGERGVRGPRRAAASWPR